ncbi:MAG: CAP domain-containing protein [Planctomycetota bacterium]
MIRLLALTTALLLAGCPADPDNGGSNLPLFSSSGPGNTAGGDNSSATGPPAGSSAGSGEPAQTVGTSGVTPGPAVSGDSAGQAAPDEFTVRYPSCQEPIQGGFWRQEVLRLVNQERRDAGVGSVTWNQVLADEAAEYACEMVQYNFFDHIHPITGSTLRDRSQAADYDYWIVGENLAAGQRTPVEVVSAWMASPCHRENVLNPAFTELGVAVRYGGTYGYYWVQEFGRPFSAPAYPGPPHRDPGCTHEE